LSTIDFVFPGRHAIAALVCMAVAGCGTGHAPPEFGGNWKPLPAQDAGMETGTARAPVALTATRSHAQSAAQASLVPQSDTVTERE
jgi:hypothetical protein